MTNARSALGPTRPLGVSGSGWPWPHRSAAAAALGLVLGASSALAQAPASLRGRVFDAGTQAGVADVAIVVVGTGFGTVSNGVGLFEFPVLPPGKHQIRLNHVAYGEWQDTIRLGPGDDLTVRINLSPTAIEMEGVVGRAQRAEDRDSRARGTSANVITRDQIESMIVTGQSLDQVLARFVPGVTVKPSATTSATGICVEFRSPRTLQDPLACKSPVIFIDGVRTQSAAVWSTFPIEEIERLEVVPSVEAGSRYGTDASYGAVIIETRTGNSVMGVSEASRRRSTYDWALESEAYPWAKVFAASFVGNAVGLAAGALIGQGCFQFEEGLANAHFFLESSCSRAATAGSAVALFGLPMTGATFATNLAGRTDLSQGRWIPTAVAAAIAIVPGYILVVAKEDESFSGSGFIGWGALTIGVPLFTTIADRLFRDFRGDPLGSLRDQP